MVIYFTIYFRRRENARFNFVERMITLQFIFFSGTYQLKNNYSYWHWTVTVHDYQRPYVLFWRHCREILFNVILINAYFVLPYPLSYNNVIISIRTLHEYLIKIRYFALTLIRDKFTNSVALETQLLRKMLQCKITPKNPCIYSDYFESWNNYSFSCLIICHIIRIILITY